MILDGMAQNHSMLPWLGNLKTFDKHIQQHIIGVLTHGKDVNLYRYLFALTQSKPLTLIVCLFVCVKDRSTTSSMMLT
jgi:hypothetical protein